MFNQIGSRIGAFSITVLSLLPLWILYPIAHLTYLVVYKVVGYRRHVVRENLINSFPEKPLHEIIQIEKTFFRFLSDLIFEIIKMKSISKAELNKRVVFKNTHLVEEYLQRNEGVIFCSAHYGNYEWVCLAIGAQFSGKHYAIYKPLNNPIFDTWFLNMRSKLGNQMVPMRQTLRAVQNSKTEASMFTFGSDQAPVKEDSKYWTTFLNQDSAIQLGTEKIAKKTNRPVFYLKINYLKRGYYEVECVPICLEPQKTEAFEITELHTVFLEKMIVENPPYWLWSHKRWKHKKDAVQN